MLVRYTTTTGRLTIEYEAATAKQAFEFVAAVAELFEEPECGCCKSKNIRPEKRVVGDYTYFAFRCGDCDAQLSFGQKKDLKSLFAKRTDENKQALGNRGWHHWRKDDGQQSSRQQHRPAANPGEAPPDDPGGDIPF